MGRIALVLIAVILVAACASSGQRTTEPHGADPSNLKVDQQLPLIGTRTFAPGALQFGDTVRCGRRGMAAAVPAAGEGVNAVADGVTFSSTIDIVHKESGIVVVRCTP
jgi:hypothetical protein